MHAQFCDSLWRAGGGGARYALQARVWATASLPTSTIPLARGAVWGLWTQHVLLFFSVGANFLPDLPCTNAALCRWRSFTAVLSRQPQSVGPVKVQVEAVMQRVRLGTKLAAEGAGFRLQRIADAC